jgi:signal transduction histidine kinase
VTVHKPDAIISFLITGSFIADALLLAEVTLSFSLFQSPNSLLYLLLASAALAYLSLCTITLRAGYVRLSAKMILILYYSLAICAALGEGVTSPISILLYCFFILVGGVLLGSTYVVRTTVLSIGTLFLLQSLVIFGVLPQGVTTVNMLALAAYSILFGVFALVGWIAASQIERALHDSFKAKAETLHQKELLAKALESEEYRRQSLQIEEMHNLHQFAELGQQTTLLLHEFANQLTTLSMDIDDPSTSSRKHANATLKAMHATMQTVRDKLNTDTYEVMSVEAVVKEIVTLHKSKLKVLHIRLLTTYDTQLYRPMIYGDPLKLGQILNILIDNAVQAYAATNHRKPQVIVECLTNEKSVKVRVVDYGSGITSKDRKRLFEAKHSTKMGGHGIGLYIAKRIIEQHFRGTLELEALHNCTAFTITLPRIR